MNTSIKFFATCFLALVAMGFSTPQSQEVTELKVVNGTKEQSGIQIVIAVKNGDEAPMVTKVLQFESFGDFGLFEIPRTEQIIIGALPKSESIEEMTTLSEQQMSMFQPISLESAKSCNVTAKGNLSDGVNFTLSNIEW